MKQSLILVIAVLFFNACNTATPQNYFDQAVLNSNMFSFFATDMLTRQIKEKAEKLGPDNKTMVVEPRRERLQVTIDYIENSLKKVKALSPTDDTKEMLETSIALHEYVLPVYKNEYIKLADDCDKNLSETELDAEGQKINAQYRPKFETLYNKLISLGKVYAEKNNIKVQWGN